jgi:hypothetical protein
MSAQLAGGGAVASANNFNAHLVLAAGVTAFISAPSLSELSKVVGQLQPTEAVNDSGKPNAAPKPTAATAPAGASASPVAGSSAPAAAAPAAQGEAGNAVAGAQAGASSAPTASTEKPSQSPEVSFEVLKKAFLALSQKANGRALCEGVLKPFALAKLSEAKPEQYAAVLTAINKAGE